MPAILSNYLPSFISSAHARLRKDKQRTTRYFNRPKYLLAPDPSTLVQPSRILSKDGVERGYHLRNTTQTTSVTSAASLNFGSLLTGTFSHPRTQNIDNVRTRGGTFGRYLFARQKSPASPIPNRKISFPPPPTLVDILRMEPDLSPTSAVLRASDVRLVVATPSATNTRRHNNLTDTSRVRNIPTRSNKSPSISRKIMPKSPINPPGIPAHNPRLQFGAPHSFSDQEYWLKLPDTDNNCTVIEQEFNVTRASPILSSSSPSCDVCGLSGVASDEASDRALAGWVCDYLYVVVIQDICHSAWGTSHNRHTVTLTERAADHIHEVIFSARLHSTTIFLALWYIAQFPVGLVESVNVSKQSQGNLSVDDIIVQTFVVGSILATKWLNDCTFSARDWHQISSLPLKLVNSLEISALLAFDFNLNIHRQGWHSWLLEINDYHASLACLLHTNHELEAAYILTGQAIHENLRALRFQEQPRLMRP